MTIQKLLHFIWLGPLTIPPYINTWRDNHKDWVIRIWGEKDIEELDLRNIHIYDVAGKRYNQKSDIIRLEILYKYGGVYMDADIVNIRNMDFFLECKFFLCQEKYRLVSNSMIGCEKGNPILKDIIVQMGKEFVKEKPVWRSTGPGFITDYLVDKKLINIPDSKIYIDIQSLTPDITIYPYYCINSMLTTIKPLVANWGIDKADELEPCPRDLKYIKNNSFDTDNIVGVQLWMGGKIANYRKIIKIKDVKKKIKRVIEKMGL